MPFFDRTRGISGPYTTFRLRIAGTLSGVTLAGSATGRNCKKADTGKNPMPAVQHPLSLIYW